MEGEGNPFCALSGLCPLDVVEPLVLLALHAVGLVGGVVDGVVPHLRAVPGPLGRRCFVGGPVVPAADTERLDVTGGQSLYPFGNTS